MTTDLGTSSKTSWQIGAALALFATAAVSALGTVLGVLFVLLPGRNFGPDHVVQYFKVIMEGSWPYLLAEVALAVVALAFLLVTMKSAPQQPWPDIATRAAAMLIPAVIVHIVVIYLINQFWLPSGFTF
ncbi:MAG: hypothetical protein ABIR57_10520 [Aeromicrobium sp.]